MTTNSLAAAFRGDDEPWVVFRGSLDAMLEPLGDAVLACILPRPGERVLDVGCGCGTTSLVLGDMVGTGGSVTGIDVSAAMLDVARREAAARGVSNIDYVLGDAGTHPYSPNVYDAVFSRFGTMFFDDAAVAFANLRRALRPGGRLGMVCWRPLAENRWATEALEAAAVVVPEPAGSTRDDPPAFSLSSRDHITELLTSAGFMAIDIEAHDEPLQIGRGDVDEAIEFYMRLLPTGYLGASADRHTTDRLRAALRSVLERHHDPAGGVLLASASWVVTAR